MRLVRALGLLALALGIGVALPARAVSFYVEILTNDGHLTFPDVRARLTSTVDFMSDPLDPIDWSAGIVGTGLGTGYVNEATPISYQHVYDPTPDSANILQAWLFISVVDDALDLTPETASIELDGSFWRTGQATANLFFGDITALGLITTDGDTIDVDVSSVSGSGNRDFVVRASALKVKFEPVPEPATAALLGLGLAALAAMRRRGI